MYEAKDMLIYHVLLSSLYYPRYGDIYLYIHTFVNVCRKVCPDRCVHLSQKKSVWFVCFFILQFFCFSFNFNYSFYLYKNVHTFPIKKEESK